MILGHQVPVQEHLGLEVAAEQCAGTEAAVLPQTTVVHGAGGPFR